MDFEYSVRGWCAGLAAIFCWLLTCSCSGSPASPSAELPLVAETSTSRYYRTESDTIEIPRQEAFNAWALQRLGVTLPAKIEYRKYLSREEMGRYTGNANTNGFAEPSLFRIHTIWPFDNHEVIHVLTALVGRPSDFFNEGIAVSFQVDPANDRFIVEFNGAPVHRACRGYLDAGVLPLPLSRYATTSGFRGISDQVMSYRMAGSFVLHLTERFGLAAVLGFFQASTRDDAAGTIDTRMQAAFGVSLADAESAWLAMLRTQ